MLYHFKKNPDGSYCIPYCSIAIKGLFGCSPEDVKDTFDPILRVVPPEDVDDFLQSIEESAKNLSAWNCEFRVQIPGKPEKCLYGSSIPEKMSDGSILWNGYVFDITDRKHTEEVLKESEARYRTLLENLNEILFFVNTNAELGFISQNAERLMGYKPDEVIGRIFLEFIHPDDRNAVYESFSRVLDGVKEAFEYRILTKSGTPIWVRSNPHLVHSDDRVIGIQGTLMDITDMKKAEESLITNEVKLREAQKIAKMGRWDYYHTEDKLVWCDTMYDILEQNPCDFKPSYREFLNLVHPDDKQRLDDVWENTLTNKQPFSKTDHRLIMKDGRIKWISEECKTVYDEKGTPIHSVGVIIDITERKQAEEALRESEERFRAVFKESPVSILVHDKDTCEIVDANKAAIASYGFTSLEELQENDFWDEPPYSFEDAQRLMHKAANEGIQRFEWKNRKIDGEIYWELVTLRLLEIDGTERVLATCVDITDRKKIEETLHQSEQRYKSLLAGSYDIIYYTTIDGKCIDISLSAETILGYTMDELKSLNVREIYYHPEERDKFIDILDKVGVVNAYEVELKHKTGKKLHCLLTANIVHDEKGHPIAIQGFVKDVTEQRKLQEMLIQSHRMEVLGKFAGGIAHDFNNLLTVIYGFTQMSLMRIDEKHPLYRNLKTVADACKKSTKLTKQLLTFARKESTETIVTDVNKDIQSVVKMLRRVTSSNIKIKLNLSPETCAIRVGPVSIDQIITNLVVNARDAMPQGGEINIETKIQKLNSRLVVSEEVDLESDYVKIKVSDTGCGMNPEVLSKIFEPLFTTKKEGKGTGLGLATVYGIVKSFKGYIFVESEERKGTTFCIYFPLSSEPVTKQYKDKVDIEDLQGTESILVVDDEETVRKMLCMELKKFGYTMLDADSGESALQIFSEMKDSIDLVISDVMMPGINGLQLYAKISELWGEVKIIFISGYSRDALLNMGIDLQDYTLISKPFDMDDITKIIKRAFKK